MATAVHTTDECTGLQIRLSSAQRDRVQELVGLTGGGIRYAALAYQLHSTKSRAVDSPEIAHKLLSRCKWKIEVVALSYNLSQLALVVHHSPSPCATIRRVAADRAERILRQSK